MEGKEVPLQSPLFLPARDSRCYPGRMSFTSTLGIAVSQAFNTRSFHRRKFTGLSNEY